MRSTSMREPAGKAISAWILTIGAVIVGALLVAHPFSPCDPGRICVNEAGVSLAIPNGWSAQQPDNQNNLFVAGRNDDPSGVGVIVRLGSGILPEPSARAVGNVTLDDLEKAAMDYSSGAQLILGRNSQAVATRVTLPVGPAVRLEYTSYPFLRGASQQIDHWFFASGQPVLFDYGTDQGEVTGNPADLDAFLSSLRVLDGSWRTWALISTVVGLIVVVLGVVGVGVVALGPRFTAPRAKGHGRRRFVTFDAS